MVEQRPNKLTKLFSEWPRGAVYSSSWLKERGYGPDLLSGYKKRGWVTSLGRGAYVRFDEEPTWEGGIYALQQQLELPVHIGGFTALQLQGYGHFVSPRLTTCHLYASRKLKLPKWFRSYDWKLEMIFHISTMFEALDAGVKEMTRNQIPVKIASPEQAILEMLSHVNSEATFIHAWQIMEGLTTLRPKLMQELLEQCKSIKVTRLCLYMGEKNQLQWYQRLNSDKFNLGTGKRSIVKSGKLNDKFQITVPEKLEED